jgi:hypothetical protein
MTMPSLKRFGSALSIRFGWISVSLCCAAAAACVLDHGIRIGSRLEIQSRKDFLANKIINDPLLRCRYLYLSGIVERELRDDSDLAPCGLFGSN